MLPRPLVSRKVHQGERAILPRLHSSGETQTPNFRQSGHSFSRLLLSVRAALVRDWNLSRSAFHCGVSRSLRRRRKFGFSSGLSRLVIAYTLVGSGGKRYPSLTIFHASRFLYQRSSSSLISACVLSAASCKAASSVSLAWSWWQSFGRCSFQCRPILLDRADDR